MTPKIKLSPATFEKLLNSTVIKCMSCESPQDLQLVQNDKSSVEGVDFSLEFRCSFCTGGTMLLIHQHKGDTCFLLAPVQKFV
jgi:hypothetical protein